LSNLNQLIKQSKTRVFRKAFVKRRLASTGLFESEWQEITNDVKSWGTIKLNIDDVRKSKITFGNLSIKVANDNGKYNDETNDNSLWFGFASQQRTLVKIEAGFLDQTLGADGIYTNTFINGQVGIWDSSLWDGASYDVAANNPVFIGLLVGDLPTNDKNEKILKVNSLLDVFRKYPAEEITGYTTTGLTASDFITLVRDHTDGSSNFIFRPFFDNTITSWDISTTTTNYLELNTTGAKDVIDKDVWSVIEKLAEAEQHVPRITKGGQFKFNPQGTNQSVTSYEFHGLGSTDRTFGKTIKKINSFGVNYSKYYSRVQVKFKEANTSTSYATVKSDLLVSGSNGPWNLGHKTLNINNNFIATSTVAQTVAQNVFDDVSSGKDEINFTASFVPQIELLDRISVTYDSSPLVQESLWDQRNWAAGSDELIWDKSPGDAILLNGVEFEVLSVELDIDKFETRIRGKES